VAYVESRVTWCSHGRVRWVIRSALNGVGVVQHRGRWVVGRRAADGVGAVQHRGRWVVGRRAAHGVGAGKHAPVKKCRILEDLSLRISTLEDFLQP
jgi:hypothetical protein